MKEFSLRKLYPLPELNQRSQKVYCPKWFSLMKILVTIDTLTSRIVSELIIALLSTFLRDLQAGEKRSKRSKKRRKLRLSVFARSTMKYKRLFACSVSSAFAKSVLFLDPIRAMTFVRNKKSFSWLMIKQNRSIRWSMRWSWQRANFKSLKTTGNSIICIVRKKKNWRSTSKMSSEYGESPYAP